MSRRIVSGHVWRHSTSALLALCSAFLAAPGQGHAAAFTPPEPATYGARLEAGDAASAREWLDAGLDPDTIADRIGTGLMIGAWTGDLEMMKLFLARGADVNKANAAGEQALMHAAWRGNLAAVDLLLASGARVNQSPMRWSALHYAVFAGHREVMARLLARGADIDARSTNGSSVLMMAVYEGHEALARELLARGADRGVKNDRGDGALEWAFKFRRLGIARLVAGQEQFAAAANRPAAAWGAPLRSVAESALPVTTRDEAAALIEELEKIRAVLAARGMTESLKKMDRRIAILRESMLPAPRPAAAAAAGVNAPQLSELDELLRTRAILVERGLARSVQTLDRRIAALRAQRARADMDVPAGALLEITASRAAPEEQSARFVIDASAPQP
jgi:hypothetical protein